MADLELDDIQGIVARGHGKLVSARFLLLQFGEIGPARTWLSSVARHITAASERAEEAAVQLAFSAGGLRKLGLDEVRLELGDQLQTFLAAGGGGEFDLGRIEDPFERILHVRLVIN